MKKVIFNIIIVVIVGLLATSCSNKKAETKEDLQKKYKSYFVKYDFKDVETFAAALNDVWNILSKTIDNELETNKSIDMIFSEDNENLKIPFTVFSKLLEDNKDYTEDGLVKEILEKYQNKMIEIQKLYYSQMQNIQFDEGDEFDENIEDAEIIE